MPNLDKWYCYTKTLFILNNRGLVFYVIARMPVTKEAWLKDYVYDYSYVFAGMGNEAKGSSYHIPLDWIIDGVNCSVEAIHKWTILPERIDADYTHCGKMDRDPNHFFHGVRRKYLSENAEGRTILQGANSPTGDFNPIVMASLIEEQGSAIDAKGTPYTTKTYDGVIPIDKRSLCY